jgi:hypothetical protein
MKIYDMKGTLIMSQETEVGGGQQLVTFNVSRLSRGVYALQVLTGKSESRQIIVKQ